MGHIGPQQLLIVALIFILLFGARKLPETAKGIAQSLRVFKKEIRDEDKQQSEESEQLTAGDDDAKPDQSASSSTKSADSTTASVSSSTKSGDSTTSSVSSEESATPKAST